MKMNSPHDTRYTAKWTNGYLEIFYDGESVARACISTPSLAKKMFRLVTQSQYELADIIRFNNAAEGLIGVDIQAMGYSADRKHILYQGRFFADA